MKILVTGGAGFIGSNLSRKLVNEGHEVVVLDSLLRGNKLDKDPDAICGFSTARQELQRTATPWDPATPYSSQRYWE